MRFLSIFSVLVSFLFVSVANANVFLPSQKSEPVVEKSVNKVPDKIVFSSTNTIILRGAITGDTATDVTRQLFNIKGEELFLFIDSPGGSVVAAARIMAALKSSGKNVVCVAETAISAAFMIFQSCNLRLATYSAITMQHNASLAVNRKEIPNFKTFSDFIFRMLDQLNEMQSLRIGITVDELNEKTKDDWWLFSKDIVDSNVADSLVEVSCTKDAVSKKISGVIGTFTGPVNVFFSGCPVLSDIEVQRSGRRSVQELDALRESLNTKEPIRDALYGESIK